MNNSKITQGNNCLFDPNTIIGYQYKPDCGLVSLSDNCRFRSGSVVYADVSMGSDCQIGHNAVIREHTVMGSHIVFVTGTVIEGHVRIGDFVKIESNCFIPTHNRIGSRVFIGPGVILTNDRYPQNA